jgi:CHAT domain-containing protein
MIVQIPRTVNLILPWKDSHEPPHDLRGQNVQGEGIVGLTRALQYAGARSIVASRWPVADESTRRLMVALHRKLREGMAKDQALRQAMREVRDDPEKAHPYYWAPFFLLGDPDNVRLGGQ